MSSSSASLKHGENNFSRASIEYSLRKYQTFFTSLNATIYIKSFVLKKECVLYQTRAMDLAAQLQTTENRLRYLFPHMHRPSKLLDGHIDISPAALRRSLRDMRRRPLYRVTPKPYGINNQWNIFMPLSSFVGWLLKTQGNEDFICRKAISLYPLVKINKSWYFSGLCSHW